MQFSELAPFFDKHTIWNSDLEMYWYELMWETVCSHKVLNTYMQENQHEAYLLAMALVDFYREFTEYAEEESWSQSELRTEDLKGCNYEDICKVLQIPEETIYDFYMEDTILSEGWDKAEIERLLLECRSTVADLYFTEGQDVYRSRILSAFKRRYGLVSLFSLMVATYAKSYDDQNIFDNSYKYDEDDEEYGYNDNEDEEEQEIIVIEDSASFAKSALSQSEYFVEDMDLINAFEWLSMVYVTR